MGGLGKRILQGLKEFNDTLQAGEPLEKKFTCRKVVLDIEVVAYGPAKVKAMRALLGVSQPLFAKFLGVSPKTVRAWERGANRPSDMACRFMDEIDRNPDYWRKRLKESIQVGASTTT